MAEASVPAFFLLSSKDFLRVEQGRETFFSFCKISFLEKEEL